MKLSPLLKEKLKVDPPPQPIKCVVEVSPQRLDYVIQQLQEMGIRVDRNLISQPIPNGSYYIPAAIPADKLSEVERIPGVISISKSMIRAAGGAILSPTPTPFASVLDELLGEVHIPAVEIPSGAFFQSFPNPVKGLGSMQAIFTGMNPVSNVRIYPTSVVAKIVKDVGTNDGAGVTVAVLDTGSPFGTPQFFAKMGTLEQYTVIPEPPDDMQSHGSWCHNAVCGGQAPSPYGPVIGIAPAVQRSIHVKCLNTFPGAGSTEGILKAIEIAVKRGAQVISMSLGGPAQGNSIDQDPECKVINELVKQGVIPVIAAGNSGPNPFTCGTPGSAVDAITVGSVSITDKFLPAWWSSRLQSDWYKEHQDEFSNDLKHGDLLIKPDCTSLGGGRAAKDAAPDEVIWSGAKGWFEPFYDGLIDATGGMHGTSQATPVVAGLIACLISDGVISGVDDIKNQLKETAAEYIILDPYNGETDKQYVEQYGKSIATGWGLFKLSRFKR